jgi:hypothetical protein
MNEERFWAVVSLFDWSRSGDDDGVLEPAVAGLAFASPSARAEHPAGLRSRRGAASTLQQTATLG